MADYPRVDAVYEKAIPCSPYRSQDAPSRVGFRLPHPGNGLSSLRRATLQPGSGVATNYERPCVPEGDGCAHGTFSATLPGIHLVRPRGRAHHDIEQQTVRNQAQPPIRRHSVFPARTCRDGSRSARRRHRGLRSPLRRGLALPCRLTDGTALDPRALAALRGVRRRALRPRDPAHLPRLRVRQPDHRRRRRRRRMAHRCEEHVRQRDRPHPGGPRPGGAAGGARRRPLGHLPDREGVRGRGTAARHPLRRPTSTMRPSSTISASPTDTRSATSPRCSTC